MRGLRVGIVNPRTPFGGRLRELLDDPPFTVTELKLFESDIAGESTLTRYRDDVVVTQPLDSDAFPRLDLCWFGAEDDDVLNRLAEDAAAADVLSIVHGAVALDAAALVPGLNEVSLADRIVAVPRAASYLLGALARRVSERLPVRHVSATVLLPAGERGDAGAEELHQQVVQLLNFKDVPKDVFREQLAFNVLPGGEGGRGAALAETIARESAELSDLAGSISVQLLRVPVFHAYSLSAWFELDAEQEQRTIEACFEHDAFRLETKRGETASPISVSESPLIHVSGIRRPVESSRPGFWVTASADTTAYDPARAALEIARNSLDV